MRDLKAMRLSVPSIILAILIALPAMVEAAPGVVNVKDHGAKGDGATDDTAAIKAAIVAAGATRSESSPVGTYIQTAPTLVFPDGKYIINDQLVIGSLLEVRGEGRPIIRQMDGSKNILFSDYAWRLSVRNISFSGGKNHIDMSNPNLDTGMLIIDDCRFYGASGFAIRNAVVSTTLKITDCTFVRCQQVWCSVASDMQLMRDCWIQTSPTMGDKAVIEHHSGMMTLDNIVGVADTISSPNQRWIDNRAEWLTVRRFRFGSENGGFTPIYNYRKYYGTLGSTNPPELGTTLIMDDCFIAASGTPSRNCAIYCQEIPNLMKIRNTTFRGSQGIIVNPSIDLGNYFYANTPKLLAYSIEGCLGESTIQLPSGLLNPVIHPH